MIPNIDWSVVNTGILLTILTYVWRRLRGVDQLRQALLGLNGKGGALEDINSLKQRVQDLTIALTTLNVTVTVLNQALIKDKS